MNIKERLAKEISEHEMEHDNLTVQKIGLKEQRESKPYSPTEDHSSKKKIREEKKYNFSEEELKLLETDIRSNVKSKVIEHVLNHNWKSAIKGLKFLAESEKLFLTRDKKSE